MAEFTSPARLVGQGERFQPATWCSVHWRRKRWLKTLKAGDVVEVVDDFGGIYETTVRGVKPHPRPRGRGPQVWLHGHRASYAAARLYKPGRAPRVEVSDA